MGAVPGGIHLQSTRSWREALADALWMQGRTVICTSMLMEGGGLLRLVRHLLHAALNMYIGNMPSAAHDVYSLYFLILFIFSSCHSLGLEHGAPAKIRS